MESSGRPCSMTDHPDLSLELVAQYADSAVTCNEHLSKHMGYARSETRAAITHENHRPDIVDVKRWGRQMRQNWPTGQDLKEIPATNSVAAAMRHCYRGGDCVAEGFYSAALCETSSRVGSSSGPLFAERGAGTPPCRPRARRSSRGSCSRWPRGSAARSSVRR